MPRAVDPSVAAAVNASNSQDVYHNIVEALNVNNSKPLDIELLGNSHPLPPECDVLLDDNSVAIPKLKLLQAFVIARQIFFNCPKDFKENKFQEIRDTTAVMLLMDPEQITAANARKKVLRKYCTGSKAELEVAVNHELLVIDSFLTSRLHRHTKSPTLWGHRRWLLEVSKSMGFPHSVERDLTAAVLIAAERHPRNYYAWLHMRWLLQTFSGADNCKILSVVKDWCLRHPADTSGWSYLLFCLFSESSKTAQIEINSSICKEVLGPAVSFQWVHESVWVFLRTLVATGEVHDEQRASFFKAVEASIATQADNSKAESVLRAAQKWCAEYSV